MKQHTFILFFVFLSSFCFAPEPVDPFADKAIRPLVYQTYKNITIGDIRRGYEITEPGLYTVAASNVKIRTSDSPSVSSSVLVNEAAKTNALIAIRSNNVTVDLGESHISTDNTGNYVGIIIADDVNNVTIRNGTITSGSENFDSGILVGEGCSNIILEDLVIQGCDGSDGAVNFLGTVDTSGPTDINSIRNSTLKNLNISNNTTFGLKCSYCKDMILENIKCNSNSSTSDPVRFITIQDSSKIKGNNIEINNCSASDDMTCLDLYNSSAISLTNISTSNGSSGNASKVQGVVVESSKNVTLSNLSINNITQMKQGIQCKLSLDVTINNLQINNCTDTSGAGQPAQILIAGCYHLQINDASISNNSITSGDGIGIKSKANGATKSKGISLNNISLINNSAAGTNKQYEGISIENTEYATISNCTIAQNTSTENLYGIFMDANTNDITCENVDIINNSSTTSTTGKEVKGILADTVNGLKILNCNVLSNSGAGKNFGYYIAGCDYFLMKNSTAQGNKAATSIAEDKPSSGLYLRDSHYCNVENCLFNNNQAGDNDSATLATDAAAAGGIDLPSTTVGAGIINIGVSETNTGNSFINCTCNNNQTQLTTTAPQNASYVSVGGPPYRYSTRYLLAVGAANQDAKYTSYKNCTFNSNGINNDYIVSCGLLNVNNAKKTALISCTANNNNHYGFADDCIFNSGTTNGEIYCIGCLAISNGSANTTIASVEVTDGHERNCRSYFTANGGTETVPPFLQVDFDTVSSDIGTSQSSNMNISIIETT